MSTTVTESMLGAQEPTHRTVPPYVSTSGQEAVELAEMAGLHLDPWQQMILADGLGEAPDGKWAAFEVAEIVSRQNGKGAVFEARELAGLFLLGERLVIHTAHEFKTAAEAFRRVESLVSNTDSLRKRVKRVDRTRGEEGIELLTGQRLRFLARSKGSGRGFTGDCVILDEAYELGDDQMAALLPTLSARPNPQLWYGSSAGMITSVQLGRIWKRGRRACPCAVCAQMRVEAQVDPDPSLAYFEWAAQLCTWDCRPECDRHDNPADPDVWAKTNPGLGIRISTEHIAREAATMSADAFARERLGVGEYPLDEDGWAVIAEAAWKQLTDPSSEISGVVALAADVTPGATSGAIAMAGRRSDGLDHVEVIEHRPGVGWMVPRIRELVAKWSPCAVVVDAAGPAGPLIAALEAGDTMSVPVAAPVEVVKPTARDAAHAAQSFYTAVVPQEGNTPTLRHLEQGPLDAALSGAQKRPLGDGWAWDRKGVAVDISPLVAGSLALWGHATRAHITTHVVLDGSLMA